MPEVRETIELKLPEDAVPQVMRTVLQSFDYRVSSADLGSVTGTRVETGQVFRARKFLRFEFAAQWSLSDQSEADSTHEPGDERGWPNLTISIRIAEHQNNWTGGRCAQELKLIVNAIPAQIASFKRRLSGLAGDRRFGSAKWSGIDDLKRNGFLTDAIQPDRLLVGQFKADGTAHYIDIPKREADRHALICGPTGSGKTQTIFVPNLIERTDASAIVTEATPAGLMPDLLKLTAAYRKQKGHNVFYFNPGDPRSHRLNPIDAVKTVSDAQDLADIIIRNTTTNKHVGDQVWETAERLFLTALIMKAALEKGSIADVRRWLTKGPKQLKKAILDAPPSKGRAEALSFFHSSTEGFLNGVLVGLMVRLGAWLNPTVIALTSETSIDLKLLEDSLFTFYLCVPSGARQIKPAASVMLNFVLDRVLAPLAKTGRLAHPTMLLLDELANFGYIPDLVEQLTIMRHAGAQFVLGLQDVEQLRSVYGNSTAKIVLSQPATRVFFKPNEIDTAREISNQLGQGTRIDLGRMNVYPRKLLSPEEVMTLDDDRAICFMPKGSPVQIWKIMPGSYQHLAAEPPLPDPVVVDESLLNAPDIDGGMLASAKQEAPQLFNEPATEKEQNRDRLKQNERLDRNTGRFRRQLSRKLGEKFKKRPGDG